MTEPQPYRESFFAYLQADAPARAAQFAGSIAGRAGGEAGGERGRLAMGAEHRVPNDYEAHIAYAMD